MNPFALTAEERAGAMMAPARTPDVGAFMDNLGALRAMLGPSVASRMQEHGEDQEARWDAGERGPTPLTEDRVWLADDVAGALLGPMGMAGVIKAYHGSPHRFDRFDMSKIGTGEGAQAFGHGLYFAESPGVAGSYRDQLAQWTVDYPTGERIPPGQWGKVEQGIISQALAAGGIDKGAGEIERRLTDLSAKMEKAADFPDRLSGLEQLRANLEYDLQFLRGLESSGATVSNPGALYTTRLDVEPEDLLDWDAPLSEQSEKVRKLAADALGLWTSDSPARQAYVREKLSGSGDWFYRKLVAEKGSHEAASAALREAGIPGIRYLDQGSRASGEGTRNFVIFDDKLIKIDEVDGKPVGSGMKAFHSTYEDFDEFDMSRLGSGTAENATSWEPGEFAYELSQLGPWLSSKSLVDQAYPGGQALEFVLGDAPSLKFDSLDDLHAAILDAGGFSDARAKWLADGKKVVEVADEEFGGTSYVVLDPAVAKRVKP